MRNKNVMWVTAIVLVALQSQAGPFIMFVKCYFKSLAAMVSEPNVLGFFKKGKIAHLNFIWIKSIYKKLF